MVQEYFGSRDNALSLMDKLLSAGFQPQLLSFLSGHLFDGLTFLEKGLLSYRHCYSQYRSGDVHVDIQPIEGEHHLAKENPVPVGFVLSFHNDLECYPTDHPLRQFFAKLDSPKAYGGFDIPAKYSIDEYLSPPPLKEVFVGT